MTDREYRRGAAADKEGGTAAERGARRAAAAERALAEAEARRAAAPAVARPKELGGRDGPEPVRYGDYEIRGIACDF